MHLEGDNAALRETVEHLQQAASLTDLFASHNFVKSSGAFHAKNLHHSVTTKQAGMNDHERLNQDVIRNLGGQSDLDNRQVFHWTGVDICEVAKQRDNALKEAMTTAAELQRSQRELFLINSKLQVARSIEESAAKVHLCAMAIAGS